MSRNALIEQKLSAEAAFPSAVATPDDRPGWMVNLTNDGWFGISTGPYP
jgi:apolipoprotein N-acyltransferase